MILRFPFDLMLCKHMVIAGDAKSNGTILLIGQFRCRNRIEVKIDDIVHRPDGICRYTLQFFLIIHIDIAQA